MKTTKKQIEEIPLELFDGNAVLAEVREIEGSAGRTSHENVSDVWDAVVRLIRKRLYKATGGTR